MDIFTRVILNKDAQIQRLQASYQQKTRQLEEYYEEQIKKLGTRIEELRNTLVCVRTEKDQFEWKSDLFKNKIKILEKLLFNKNLEIENLKKGVRIQ